MYQKDGDLQRPVQLQYTAEHAETDALLHLKSSACAVGTDGTCVVQYVPLGPTARPRRGGKGESAAFKPPHAGSSGPLGKYEYIPCPAIKQVRRSGACPEHICCMAELQAFASVLHVSGVARTVRPLFGKGCTSIMSLIPGCSVEKCYTVCQPWCTAPCLQPRNCMHGHEHEQATSDKAASAAMLSLTECITSAEWLPPCGVWPYILHMLLSLQIICCEKYMPDLGVFADRVPASIQMGPLGSQTSTIVPGPLHLSCAPTCTPSQDNQHTWCYLV